MPLPFHLLLRMAALVGVQALVLLLLLNVLREAAARRGKVVSDALYNVAVLTIRRAAARRPLLLLPIITRKIAVIADTTRCSNRARIVRRRREEGCGQNSRSCWRRC